MKKIVGLCMLLLCISTIGYAKGMDEIDNNGVDGEGMHDLSFSPVLLQVFGNSNGDDRIDGKDIEHIRGIVRGSHEKTVLSDANNDGIIDQQDIEQVEQIIAGTETRLYYMNCDGEAVSVQKPINRIVVAYSNNAEMVRVLNAQDKVVAIDDNIAKYPRYFPVLSKKPQGGERLRRGSGNGRRSKHGFGIGKRARAEWSTHCPKRHSDGLPSSLNISTSAIKMIRHGWRGLKSSISKIRCHRTVMNASATISRM